MMLNHLSMLAGIEERSSFYVQYADRIGLLVHLVLVTFQHQVEVINSRMSAVKK